MTLSSQCFCAALRGLQVVCYGWCLGDGDKVNRACCRQGEVASGFTWTHESYMLRHRLFSVADLKKKHFLVTYAVYVNSIKRKSVM